MNPQQDAHLREAPLEAGDRLGSLITGLPLDRRLCRCSGLLGLDLDEAQKWAL